MTAQLLHNGKQTFIDANGDPLAGGKVYFYEPGTTNPKDTWQDPDKSVFNSNPVELDAAGQAVIYGFGVYRQVVHDKNDNLVWDQLTASVPVHGQILWAGTSEGTNNLQELSLENSQEFILINDEPLGGQAVAFVAGATNDDALDVMVTWDGSEESGPHDVLKRGPNGPVELGGGEVRQGNMYLMVWDDESSAFHLTSVSPTVPAVFSVFIPVNEQTLVLPFDGGEIYILPENADRAFAYAETPADEEWGDVDIQVLKNETEIGTVRFEVGENQAEFIGFAAATTFIGGQDRLVLKFPDEVEESELQSLGISFHLLRTG